MKNAPKTARNDKENDQDDEKSFSDIGEQDFDEFEIADDFDTEVSESTKGWRFLCM